MHQKCNDCKFEKDTEWPEWKACPKCGKPNISVSYEAGEAEHLMGGNSGGGFGGGAIESETKKGKL